MAEENNTIPEIEPENRIYSTLAGVSLRLTVDAIDIDGDILSYSADTPVSGNLIGGGDGSFLYIPSAGFTGADNFTVTVSDGFGGFAHRDVQIFITAPPTKSDWFLITSSGYIGAIGGNGIVYGTTGFQDITVLRGISGAVRFDSSFGQGGDVIRMVGNASEWHVMVQGASAVFTSGMSVVTIPVGLARLCPILC